MAAARIVDVVVAAVAAVAAAEVEEILSLRISTDTDGPVAATVGIMLFIAPPAVALNHTLLGLEQQGSIGSVIYRYISLKDTQVCPRMCRARAAEDWAGGGGPTTKLPFQQPNLTTMSILLLHAYLKRKYGNHQA